MNHTWKKLALFAGGVLFGTAGIDILKSRDAKKLYTHTTAAVASGHKLSPAMVNYYYRSAVQNLSQYASYIGVDTTKSLADQVYDGLSYLEDYLDWLDPEQKGMTITAQGDTDRYEVGGHVLFTRTRGENGLSFRY